MYTTQQSICSTVSFLTIGLDVRNFRWCCCTIHLTQSIIVYKNTKVLHHSAHEHVSGSNTSDCSEHRLFTPQIIAFWKQLVLLPLVLLWQPFSSLLPPHHAWPSSGPDHLSVSGPSPFSPSHVARGEIRSPAWHRPPVELFLHIHFLLKSQDKEATLDDYPSKFHVYSHYTIGFR